STVDSHRLIAYADKQGKQLQVVEELFNEYFVKNTNIGDVQVLADAAQRAGLDRAQVEEYLKSDAGLPELLEEFKNVKARGINGVPHLTIDGKYDVSGAQEPETLVQIFEKLIARP
ncbi:thioredoxin-like protein, partial [Blyttiomyces helicus]